MNNCVREIRDPADVVEVEMRRDDMTDVFGSEAETFDLSYRGLVAVERRPEQEPRRPQSARRIGDVIDAEAGVDENQTVVGFDEQDVADLPWCPRRKHGPAIEVVNPHRASL
jgi:hypothetical protein